MINGSYFWSKINVQRLTVVTFKQGWEFAHRSFAHHSFAHLLVSLKSNEQL